MFKKALIVFLCVGQMACSSTGGMYNNVIERGSEAATATGGVLEALIGWDIDKWKADAVAYQVSRP